jgi:hypothetical protein
MRSLRKPLLAATLVAVAVAAPALAQQSAPPPPSPYPAACDASKVSRSDVDRAHGVFLSGKGYLEVAEYDKAISYFKDAYTIDCSVHGILPIIATAYERKGDKQEAVRALEEYQRRAPSAPDHDVMDRRIRNLKDQLAREQPSASAPVALPSASATVAPPPSATAESAPAPDAGVGTYVVPEGGHSATPWYLVGAGGVAIAAGVVLFVVGAGDVSTAEARCGGDRTKCKAGSDQANSDAVSLGNTGRTLETVGAIAGGAGVVAVAAGLWWHFSEHPSAERASVRPVVAPGYAGVGVGGSF